MDKVVPINPVSETDTIIAAIVERVSDRLARGVPLSLAVGGGPQDCEEFEDQLRRYPTLAALIEVAKCNFVEYVIAKLLDVEDPSSNIRWLLERLYPEVFCLPQDRQREKDKEPAPTTTNAGMTPDALKRFREGAKML